MNKLYVYKCGNRKVNRGRGCKQLGVEFKTSFSPAAYRTATGRSIVCGHCGDVAYFVRTETAEVSL